MAFANGSIIIAAWLLSNTATHNSAFANSTIAHRRSTVAVAPNAVPRGGLSQAQDATNSTIISGCSVPKLAWPWRTARQRQHKSFPSLRAGSVPSEAVSARRIRALRSINPRHPALPQIYSEALARRTSSAFRRRSHFVLHLRRNCSLRTLTVASASTRHLENIRQNYRNAAKI